ncbi:hypothetical protein AMTR_s00157p00050570 [Amborella trichopoda]|uniref:Uncharacterized protein n=1 Tax=Amborella trichopoda TaxID=13333 RepID=W1PHV7_AMBTC|nr:hypothetical protein AMTR_s00157p00050570 [Amborella trichopoda]
MGFISFAGRVSFSSSFTLAAWQRFHEFGDDGGPAVKLLEPKYALLKNYVASSLGFQVPEIEIKHLIAAKLALKGIVDCSIECAYPELPQWEEEQKVWCRRLQRVIRSLATKSPKSQHKY